MFSEGLKADHSTNITPRHNTVNCFSSVAFGFITFKHIGTEVKHCTNLVTLLSTKLLLLDK